MERFARGSWKHSAVFLEKSTERGSGREMDFDFEVVEVVCWCVA